MHPTYKKNPIVYLHKAPYLIKRGAWGYFDLKITIYYKKVLKIDPTELEFTLWFDGNGKSFKHNVKIDKDLLTRSKF